MYMRIDSTLGRWVSALSVATCIAIVATNSMALALPSTQTIALTGTDGVYGPNQGPGVFFGDGTLDGQPAINNSGSVLLRGNNNAVGTPAGLWLNTSGINNNIALGGQAMPGGGTYAASNGGSISAGIMNNMQLNHAGHTAFRLGSGYGLFSDTGSGMGRTMLTLDQAPGTGGATFSSVGSSPGHMFNANGNSAFIGNLTNGTGSPAVTFTSPNGNSTGLWIGTSSLSVPNPNLTLALRQNQPLGPDNSGGSNLPGLLSPSDPNYDASGNTRIGALQTATPSWNGNNRFALVSQLQGTNVITSTSTVGYNRDIVATNRSGAFGIIARSNGEAVDASGNSTSNTLWRTFGTSMIGINNMDHVAFSATLKTAGTAASLGTGLFTDQGTGTLRKYAFQGEPMPSVQTMGGGSAGFSGTNWGSGFGTSLLTGNDSLVMSVSGLNGGDVTGVGQNDSAILSLGADGQLRKLARTFEAVSVLTTLMPGEFARMTAFQSGLAANSMGQVAFTSTLGSSLGSSGSVSGLIGNNLGLFATFPDGTLSLIAQRGELFFAPGMAMPLTVSAINGITTSGGQDGRSMSLNDNGDLAYSLQFSDGSSGVFVTRVPEPGTAALTFVAGIAALIRRRRAV